MTTGVNAALRKLCNHGNCPECSPCQHCFGGDREDKFFGYDPDTGEERVYQ